MAINENDLCREGYLSMTNQIADEQLRHQDAHVNSFLKEHHYV
jgi:hypothetical protein